MKKIFTLCIALFSAMSMFAQSDFNSKDAFQFCDKAGNVIASGSVITRTELEESDFLGMQINSGLYVKQNMKTVDGVEVCPAITVEITRIDHGDLTYCYPATCHNVIAEEIEIPEGESHKESWEPEEPLMDFASFNTEWIPGIDDDGNPLFGECDVKFTLTAYKLASVSKDQYGIEKKNWEELGENTNITIHFVNADPTAINGVADNANVTEVARYAADGSRLSAPQKGLNIVKLSNGKTVKYIK